jgi:hypothetical protein
MEDQDNLATYEGLLAAGQENSRYQQMMEAQKAQAEMMRQRGVAPEGQMISGHYVAPHVLQQLGSLANNVGAAYKDKQAQEAATGLNKSMGDQNSLILKALLRNQQAAQPKPPTPAVATPPINVYPTITPQMKADAEQQGLMGR